jgi:plastocyanin
MRVLAVVVVAVVGLSGCGKDKKSDNGAAMDLQAKNFAFSPNTLTVKAGEKVTITFANGDSAEHNLTIESANVNKDLEAGKTTTVTFTAPSSAGDQQFFCEYHKTSKNMVGTLHVTA